MTSRSFALSSLVAAIPGAAVAVLVVLAILNHAGTIFKSIPLAATLIVALICGLVVTIAPIVIFFRGRSQPEERLAPVPRPGEESGEMFVADGSSDELAAADSSAAFPAAGDTSGEIFADEGVDDGDDFADSSEFVSADSAEFEEEDDDPFADFDDADAGDDDSFFDQPASGR